MLIPHEKQSEVNETSRSFPISATLILTKVPNNILKSGYFLGTEIKLVLKSNSKEIVLVKHLADKNPTEPIEALELLLINKDA